MTKRSNKRLITGASEIAEYVGCTRRQIYHWAEKMDFPVFSIGRTVCARPDMIDEWLQEQALKAGQGGNRNG